MSFAPNGEMRLPGRLPQKAAAAAMRPRSMGAVSFASRRPWRSGEIATVRTERADEYDLHAVWSKY